MFQDLLWWDPSCSSGMLGGGDPSWLYSRSTAVVLNVDSGLLSWLWANQASLNLLLAGGVLVFCQEGVMLPDRPCMMVPEPCLGQKELLK